MPRSYFTTFHQMTLSIKDLISLFTFRSRLRTLWGSHGALALDTWFAVVRSILSVRYRRVQLLRTSCAPHFYSVKDGEQHIFMRVSSTARSLAIMEATSSRGLDG